MKKILLAFFVALVPIFGAEVEFAKSDFVMRTVNFVIFVAILWYLVAGWIRNALKTRQEGIASQLNAVQDKLKESLSKKETAQKELSNSKQLAQTIIQDAKKEAQILTQNIESQCNIDIENIKKSHAERLNFEQKRAKVAVVDEILDELLSDKNIPLTKKDFVEILTKRVA